MSIVSKVLFVSAMSAMCSVATAQTGFYIDGSFGATRVSGLPEIAGVSLDKKDTSWSLGGGYMFSPNFGIEAGYQDLGEAAYSASVAGTFSALGNTFTGTGSARLSAKATGIYLGPTATIPLNEKFALTARAGWYKWKAKATLQASAAGVLNGTAVAAGFVGSETVRDTETYFGVGVRYKINDRFSLDAGVTRFNISDIDINNYSLTARMAF